MVTKISSAVLFDPAGSEVDAGVIPVREFLPRVFGLSLDIEQGAVWFLQRHTHSS